MYNCRYDAPAQSVEASRTPGGDPFGRPVCAISCLSSSERPNFGSECRARPKGDYMYGEYSFRLYVSTHLATLYSTGMHSYNILVLL